MYISARKCIFHKLKASANKSYKKIDVFYSWHGSKRLLVVVGYSVIDFYMRF